MRPAGWIGAAAILTLTVWARAETDGNLLRNPGFEELITGLPAAWKAFVYPAPGAHARLIEPGHGGARAAALVIATPYRREPDNNWSQHVAVPAGARRLRFAGWVRAEGPGADAFMWLQCWQRRPARLLAEVRTLALSRRGEWVYAEAALDVPAGTDFAMARLTLRGSGEGWFDDLELTAETTAGSGPAAAELPAAASSSPRATATLPNAAPAAASPPPTSAPAAAHPSDSPAVPPAPAADIPAPARREPEPKTSFPATDAGPPAADPQSPGSGPVDRGADMNRQTASLEQALSALRQENRLLLEALTALEAQHASVQQELAAMRADLAALRAENPAQSTSADQSGEMPAAAPEGRVPPLAPRGSEWDDVTVRPQERD